MKIYTNRSTKIFEKQGNFTWWWQIKLYNYDEIKIQMGKSHPLLWFAYLWIRSWTENFIHYKEWREFTTICTYQLKWSSMKKFKLLLKVNPNRWTLWWNRHLIWNPGTDKCKAIIFLYVHFSEKKCIKAKVLIVVHYVIEIATVD